jgi:dihydroorotase-like cyclic amidohydrolase
MKKYGARLHAMTRPNFIEAEAIERCIKWAEVTGGRLYVVHMSTAEGADLVRAAQDRGVDVYAETCVQYLVLTDSVFKHKDGHLFACCPQLKKRADQLRLWEGLRRGEVCVVSTDTCTFTREQKDRWNGDWTKIPMGLPGLETLLPLMFTFSPHCGGTKSLSFIVEKCCTNPARIMGLYPQKGVIAKGSDADVVIVDPRKKIKVDHEQMEGGADWSPYQGWPLWGWAETTLCRGRKIVDDYQFVGVNGWGQWLPREKAGSLPHHGRGAAKPKRRATAKM